MADAGAAARLAQPPASRLPHEGRFRISPLPATLLLLSAHGWIATLAHWAGLARALLAGVA